MAEEGTETSAAAHMRRHRAEEADRRLADLFAQATGDDNARGLALVAVGGYGRSELSPFSDLDVVLVHDPKLPEERVRAVAEAIWYPLWDEGVPLDHSVRDLLGMQEAANTDFRAAIGMLDARAVAGDREMVLALRSQVLAEWRRDARRRVAEVRADRNVNIERWGWVAHAAVPDLKISGGGLRDGVIMRALVATWLVDIPHAESESLRASMLDVRDALHAVTGRRTERFDPDLIPETAALLGMEAEELDLYTRDLGRRVAHMCAIAWRRIEAVLDPRRDLAGESGPHVVIVAPGVGRLGDEIVLTRDADPQADPGVVLRAAAVAAREGLSFAAGTAAHFAAAMGELPEPWPVSARQAMVELLSAGAGLVSVWDELDFEGVIDRWLPEWSAIRLRGSSSPVHRFTVDRHSLEVCVQAAALARTVARPDLLAVAALLHDIGKGAEGDHSKVGEPMARAIAERWGFAGEELDLIGTLVRRHLLLPTIATGRDIEDPATIARVAKTIGSADVLEHLYALTEADARSTSEAAWSSWRAGLIRGLVHKTHAHFGGAVPQQDYEGWPAGVPLPDLVSWRDRDFSLDAQTISGGSVITVVTGDRHGLMASLAGAFATAGLDVLSARTVTIDGIAASLWEVTRADVDVVRLRERLRAVLNGEVDLASRLVQQSDEDRPFVAILQRRNQNATILDVRARDRRGLVWVVCQAIAQLGHSIRSAHLSTYGHEARDVYYVTDADGGQLAQPDADAMRRAVLAALS
jgi:[protein-PII] uridylyltransferase